jgi:hypothetical protein
MISQIQILLKPYHKGFHLITHVTQNQASA